MSVTKQLPFAGSWTCCDSHGCDNANLIGDIFFWEQSSGVPQLRRDPFHHHLLIANDMSSPDNKAQYSSDTRWCNLLYLGRTSLLLTSRWTCLSSAEAR